MTEVPAEDTGHRRRATDRETDQDRLERLTRIEIALVALRETVADLSAALTSTRSALITAQERALTAEVRAEEVAEVANAASTRHEVRKRFALGAVFVMVLIYVAGLVYDVHVDKCVIHGPRTATAKRWCDAVFFVHDHNYDESAEGIVAERARSTYMACQQGNRRVEVEAKIFDNLAKAVPPEAPVLVVAQLRSAATELRALKTDCARLFPLEVQSR